MRGVDLNGDSLVDVLAALGGDDEVVWFENLGAGIFGPQTSIGMNVEAAFATEAADLDGDGDADVVATSFLLDQVLWFENLGAGTFGAAAVIADDLDGATAIELADLDGDGDIDVAAASLTGDRIVWYENRSGSIDCNGNGLADAFDIATGTSADCDLDGVPDECQIAAGAADCNGNAILDACEIAADPGLDANGNGELDSCEEVGVRYCSPAVPNSTGSPATVRAIGSVTRSRNSLEITATSVPSSSFGFFLTSQSQGFTFPVPASQGALCLGGAIGRFVGPGEIQ